MIIRKHAADDLDDLLTTWEAASRVAHPFLSEGFLAYERGQIANLYLKRAETWVAEGGSRVVGFLSLSGNEIGGLFVHPDWHRRGVGSALVANVSELHDVLDVEVFEKNVIGRAFYEKTGFKPLSKSTETGTGEQLLRLRLTCP